MSSGPKYQVFVSSTYEDLREERDQVIRAVLEMGHIPVGMEMFSAADDEQWKIIARHIEESDYYAVVLAHRYGSLTPEGVSFTRKEYEFARSIGVPCLGFIIDDAAAWPADQVETQSGKKKALGEFKELVKEKPVSFWSSAEELHGKFSISLMKAITANPREGWVKASAAGPGPEASAELIRLSSENARLREQVAAADASSRMERNETQREAIGILMESKRSPSYRYEAGDAWQYDREVSLYEIFAYWAPELVSESSIDNLAKVLAFNIRTDLEKSWDIVALNQVRGFLADLMTLDLAQPSSRRHAVADTNEYWELTADGIELFKQVRKIDLKSARADDPGAEEDGDSLGAVDEPVDDEGDNVGGGN
jgi:hypothetical protein